MVRPIAGRENGRLGTNATGNTRGDGNVRGGLRGSYIRVQRCSCFVFAVIFTVDAIPTLGATAVTGAACYQLPVMVDQQDQRPNG